MKNKVICDECNEPVKEKNKCICGMWICFKCTLSSLKHDTSRGEHWQMLARSHEIPACDD